MKQTKESQQAHRLKQVDQGGLGWIVEERVREEEKGLEGRGSTRGKIGCSDFRTQCPLALLIPGNRLNCTYSEYTQLNVALPKQIRLSDV